MGNEHSFFHFGNLSEKQRWFNHLVRCEFNFISRQGRNFGYTIIEDVSEKKTLRQQKEQSDISQITLNTKEEERRRISESLHNGLSQLLYGAKLAMGYLTLKIATEDPNKFQVSKDYAVKLLADSINDVRRISHELMPSVLLDFGLKAAIENICNQLKVDPLKGGLKIKSVPGKVTFIEIRLPHQILK